jgi:hypothetical protein
MGQPSAMARSRSLPLWTCSKAFARSIWHSAEYPWRCVRSRMRLRRAASIVCR